MEVPDAYTQHNTIVLPKKLIIIVLSV